MRIELIRTILRITDARFLLGIARCLETTEITTTQPMNTRLGML